MPINKSMWKEPMAKMKGPMTSVKVGPKPSLKKVPPKVFPKKQLLKPARPFIKKPPLKSKTGHIAKSMGLKV